MKAHTDGVGFSSVLPAVDPAEFIIQVIKERLGIQTLGTEFMQKLHSSYGPAVLPDILRQPSDDGGKFAIFHQLGKIGQILPDGIVDHAVIDIAQGIALEIADPGAGPMHILEDAFRIVSGHRTLT